MRKKHDYPTPLRDRLLNQVISLYEAGMSRSAIAKKFEISNSVVSKWIIFAKNNPQTHQLVMTLPREEPKSINMDELSSSTPEEQIATLKEALRRAELRADLYDEMIKVAEAKFKVDIRKKAGAKQ